MLLWRLGKQVQDVGSPEFASQACTPGVTELALLDCVLFLQHSLYKCLK